MGTAAANVKQGVVVVDDKENRRDLMNRQSANVPPAITVASNGMNAQQIQQSSSSTSLMKRSKTSDHPVKVIRQQQQHKDSIP
jgi:response regulator RpfG family c-di-GMP phosphodiesterase